MHFQQFEYLEFLFFSGEHAPGPPPPPPKKKPLQSVQPSRVRRDSPVFTWESRNPTRLQSGHEYPNFEEQFSQTNEQRNIFSLHYHKICHKINLDIQANAELQ